MRTYEEKMRKVIDERKDFPTSQWQDYAWWIRCGKCGKYSDNDVSTSRLFEKLTHGGIEVLLPRIYVQRFDHKCKTETTNRRAE